MKDQADESPRKQKAPLAMLSASDNVPLTRTRARTRGDCVTAASSSSSSSAASGINTAKATLPAKKRGRPKKENVPQKMSLSDHVEKYGDAHNITLK
jgi:hypothetical protein